MVTRLKIPRRKKKKKKKKKNEQTKVLLKHFRKAMQILVLKRMLKKARVDVTEIETTNPSFFPSATDNELMQ